MAREIFLSKKAETGLRLDPRTKLLLIFIISIFVMGGTGGEAMGLLRLVLCAIPALLLLFSKQFGKAVGYIVIFAAFYAVQISVLPHLTGILNFLVLFTTGFFCRILPSVAMAAYAIYRDRVKAVMPENMKISKPYIDKQLAEVLAQQEQIQRNSSRVATDLARLSVFKGNLREMEAQQRADEQAREQNRDKKHENAI